MRIAAMSASELKNLDKNITRLKEQLANKPRLT